jgi:copper chaperone CopZ
MKRFILSLSLLACAALAHADEKVTVSGLHNCCGGCANGIKKAGGSVAGVNTLLEGNKVTFTAAKTEDLQKAVDALVGAGYTGASDNDAVKLIANAAPDEKVKSLTVTGTHMCCGACVNAARKAVKSVDGVQSDTIAAHSDTFKVEGEFNAKAVMDALAKAGFTGKATQ